jgi:hypothetical protein
MKELHNEIALDSRQSTERDYLNLKCCVTIANPRSDNELAETQFADRLLGKPADALNRSAATKYLQQYTSVVLVYQSP